VIIGNAPKERGGDGNDDPRRARLWIAKASRSGGMNMDAIAKRRVLARRVTNQQEIDGAESRHGGECGNSIEGNEKNESKSEEIAGEVTTKVRMNYGSRISDQSQPAPIF
jgi:hypothetical protein